MESHEEAKGTDFTIKVHIRLRPETAGIADIASDYDTTYSTHIIHKVEPKCLTFKFKNQDKVSKSFKYMERVHAGDSD